MKQHPLADYHNGQPRGTIHSRYYNGYFWMRMPNAKLAVVYRPTGDRPENLHLCVQIGGHGHRKLLTA